MTTVFTVVGVTKLIYEVLERDYGIPNPTGAGGGGGVTVTAGLNQAQVQAIVNAAIAGLPAGGAGGVTQAQVDAAIAAAIAAAPAGISQAQVEALIAVAAAKPVSGPLLVAAGLTAGVQSDTAEVVAYHPQNKPVNLDLQSPGGQVRVNGQQVQTEADVIAKVVDLLSKSPTITSPNVSDPRIGGTVFTSGGTRVLSFEHASETTWLRISNGQTGPEIGVKPLTGSTIDGNIRLRPLGRGAVEIGTATSSATVKSVGDLTPDVDLVLEAQGDGKVKVGDSPVVTEDYLSGVVGPAIQQAVASQVNKINDRLTLNSTKADDSPVVVETNNLTGAQHKVGIDFVTQRDAPVTVNGHRVLTTEDALAAGGAGIDQAALEAAVQAATAPLLARIDTLEADLAAVLDHVVQTYATKAALAEFGGDVENAVENAIAVTNTAVQAVLDALNGPDATVDSVRAMFWLLNDIVVALIDATGIEVTL